MDSEVPDLSDMETWISCRKKMPEEHEVEMCTTIQHPERRTRMESDLVFAYDSFYGPCVDATINGKWRSEQHSSGITGNVCHGIIAWMPIPKINEEELELEKI